VNQEELLADLTEAQKAAVTHVDGPLLIVAAAGSGKTRVITRRVAYLISLGIPQNSILAITFTNKAAGEMKERVGKVLGKAVRDWGRLDAWGPTICTFHSLCLRVLKHYAERVGLPANFTIYDSSDQTKLVKEALKTLDMSSTNFPPSTVHAAISNAKNKLMTAAMYAQQATDFYSKQVSRVFTKYQQLLKQNNAVDFDDLMLLTANAFRDVPEVLRELQDRFAYILIDEYQDTNHAQYVIAHALAMRQKNICVVGDPDQSIYAWRGADIQNILDFETDYPDAKVVKLEQNYRSTKRILRIAGALISKNVQRKDKLLWTENAEGSLADLFLCQDEHDEARAVADEFKKLHEQSNIEWNKMAIFYRMNSLSRVMEDELRRRGMPYVMARGIEFYNRKEIKDTLAYLRVIANVSDEVNLSRIVNTPTRGIGDASVKLMQAWGVANGMTLFGAMEEAGRIEGLSSRAVNSVRQFVELVKSWRRMVYSSGNAGGTPAPREVERDETKGSGVFDYKTKTPDPFVSASAHNTGEAPVPQEVENGLEFARNSMTGKGRVQRIMEDVVKRSGLEGLYTKEAKADLTSEADPLGNINELISSAAEYDQQYPEGTLDEYLGNISLVSDADHMKGAGGAITMMTLHAAKGLEFPVVAMIGMEEGILPHARARGNLAELEEERRLCFVGITRAQRHLILSKAAYRTIRGLRERTVTSPFIGEMPKEELDVTDRADVGWDGPGRGEVSSRREERSGSGFRKGQRVRHPTFGIGTIADISDMGAHTRAVIEFGSAGRKTLILQYARLEAV
jgi:DNA helicase II / ATP-dependent DNA helicase PcrA